MEKIKIISVNSVFIYMIFLALWNPVNANDPPFTVKSDLFDQTNTDNLGLYTAEGTETITIFQPVDSTDHYSNGVVLVGFKGWLYCQWQSSAEDEDAPDTWVAYSRSQDGVSWSQPMTLATSIGDGYCSSGGWWINGDTLVGYINVWQSSVSPRGGYAYYTTSIDGLAWSPIQPLLMANGDTLDGIFEQDPHALPDGRIISAAHFQPGLIVSPIYTDDPSGIRGWMRAAFSNLSVSDNVSRELEPSWFLQGDSAIVMTFRDQSGSYRRLASLSDDRGESWTTAVLTDMPDSRSKQSAGNLPNSAAYLVGNPVNNKTRIPLVVTLSKDGTFFNAAYVLRQGGDDLQDMRYEGQYKSAGYHYPKSIVWQDYLCVSYSTNKEDVEYTRVPLTSLTIDSVVSIGYSPSLPEGHEVFTLYRNYLNPFSSTITYRLSKPGFVTLSLFDVNGQEIIVLVNEEKQPGNYQARVNVKDMAAGFYYYRLQVNGQYATKEMIIFK